MKIYLDIDESKKNQILKKLKTFKEIRHIFETNSRLIIILKKIIPYENKNLIKKVEKKYRLKGVKKVIISSVKKESNLSTKIKHKNCHCFFDIDSTLTKGNSVINRNIKNIFKKMKNDGFRIYFVSGRSIPQIQKDITEFETEPYGIAENGGIIIGLGPHSEIQHGDRTEPDKVLAFLKRKCKKAKEDIDQGFRKTERIFLNTIPEKTFRKYVKNSKAKVDIHPSKNAYHVSKKKVNKGTAIEKLTSAMNFGSDDIVIAVGDADMDVPMFEEAELSFAVGNASHLALQRAHISLTGEYDKGIAELYEELRKYII